MSKVWQQRYKESEETENKRCNRKSINSVGKLKSKKIIVILCLVSVPFLIIPVIPILLAFLAGRWLHFTGKKSF